MPELRILVVLYTGAAGSIIGALVATAIRFEHRINHTPGPSMHYLLIARWWGAAAGLVLLVGVPVVRAEFLTDMANQR